MKYKYRTKGTCSVEISFNIENNIVTDINFVGGCDGNLKMISKLLEGKEADYIINMCSENKCGWKNTSCADQLAKAVLESKDKQ